MRLSRRGLILGGSAMLAGCATGQATPLITQAQAPVAPPPPPSVGRRTRDIVPWPDGWSFDLVIPGTGGCWSELAGRRRRGGG